MRWENRPMNGVVTSRIFKQGVIGEVRKPLVDIADWRQLTPPYELLPENYAYARDIVNKSCANSKSIHSRTL